MLPDLLDEWVPVLSGVEINDDPIAPMTTGGKRILAEQGDIVKKEGGVFLVLESGSVPP